MKETPYGWVVVAAAFLVMAFGFGAAYSFPAFFAPLQAEFDAQRGDISWIFGIASFFYFLLGAVSGFVADRIQPRWIICSGMVIVGGGLLLTARATELDSIYAIYGLAVGIGVGFSYVPAIGAVQPWFEGRRGLASGLAVSGIGAGTLLAPLCAHWLMEDMDWRGAYEIFGWATIIIGGGAALAISRPGSLGRATASLPGASIREAVFSSPFAYMYLAASLGSFALFVPFVHLVSYARDHGTDDNQAITLIALIGLGSLLGRFVFGSFADKFGRQKSQAAMFAGMALISILWLLSDGFAGLAVFALVFGSFYGGFVALAPALSADYFGGKNISSIIGILYSSVAIGSLVGPPLAGYVYDAVGSYEKVIVATILLHGAACLFTLRMPVIEDWRRRVSWFQSQG